MQKGKYGNFIIYYEDNFVLYMYHELDGKIDVEKIKKRGEHGFFEVINDYPRPTIFMRQPKIKEKRVVLRQGVASSINDYKFSLVFTDSKYVISCISKAKTLEEVYGEKGKKCGNRRIKHLFGRYIDIENINPVVAHFEGIYKEYSVKGLSLGHPYYEYAPHYLMFDDKTHVASENSPRITYNFIKKYRKQFPTEELVGTVTSPVSPYPSKMKVRVDNGDYTIDITVTRNILVPKLTTKGIEFTEKPPTQYQDAVKNVEKIMDEINVKPKQVNINNKSMTIRTKHDTIIVTPQIVKIINGPTFSNSPEALAVITAISRFPSEYVL